MSKQTVYTDEIILQGYTYSVPTWNADAKFL